LFKKIFLHVLQWVAYSSIGRGRPKNTWKIDLENELWTARYKYSWRKMEVVAQDRAKNEK